MKNITKIKALASPYRAESGVSFFLRVAKKTLGMKPNPRHKKSELDPANTNISQYTATLLMIKFHKCINKNDILLFIRQFKIFLQ